MTRTGLASLTCSVLIQFAPVSLALGCPLPPPERWTQTSGNGAYELIVEPIEERRPDGTRLFHGATYRLERVGVRRATVWNVNSPDMHSEAVVAGDGDYVVTARGWYYRGGVTIRNSAGAVIRSLTADDLVSIQERLDGATWRVAGLDESEEYLLIEVDFYDEQFEKSQTITRRVQLMDGYVMDAPASSQDLEIPHLECAEPGGLVVFAGWRELELTCNARAGGPEAVRTYELENDQLRLIEALDIEHGTLSHWRRASSESEPGPCETIYRDGDVVSERCGSDVTSSP